MTRQAPSSRFRAEGRLEAIARTWPSSGVLARLRRVLKPVFETAIGWRNGGLVESRFPGGEIVRLRPAWRNLSWNPEEYAAFRDVVRRGDVVIDAGANAGGYALLFGHWVGPEGRVYAFEPEPRAFAALVHHVSINGLRDRIIPIRAALTDATGTARLRIAAASGLSRIARAAPDDPRDMIVTSTSLDDFCESASVRPSMIKVDVEGAELAVLRGASRTIDAAGSGLRLFVEMHPSAWPEFACSSEDIVAVCDRLQLSLERLDGSRSGLWDVEGVCLRLRPAALQ